MGDNLGRTGCQWVPAPEYQDRSTSNHIP
jgi:hypothetical protein